MIENKQDGKKDDMPRLERRGEERRQLKSKGFICFSMVGWYCRREKRRRKDDTYKF